jgi:hypothetical protein
MPLVTFMKNGQKSHRHAQEVMSLCIELLHSDSFGLPSGADAVKVLSCLSLEAFAKPFEAPGNRVQGARVQAGNAS